MKQYLGVVAALLASALTACGAPPPAETPAPLGEESSALVSCSTSCPSGPSLSCWGNSCSAANNAYVQCDGVYQYCATTPPPLNCSDAYEACVNLVGTPCSPMGARRQCCIQAEPFGSCGCSANNTWECTVPQDP